MEQAVSCYGPFYARRAPDLAGSTRQISRFGADQTERSRVGNDANNGSIGSRLR
jgi:hypothetical protein